MEAALSARDGANGQPPRLIVPGFTSGPSRPILRRFLTIRTPAVPVSRPARPLRTHQQLLLGVVQAIAAGGASDVHDILAAVTPGGGKSLLPVLAAHALIATGVVARVVWVVPRDSLRLQAEEAFADPAWRAALGHALSVRAADNAPDPCRGLAGYVTTYQGVAAAPALHLAEAQRHRTLLVLDEVHHLPALGDAAGSAASEAEDAAAAWSRAMLPLLECARVRLLLSGTLERADGRGILWLPYRKGPRAATREVDLAAPGWAVVGYSRAQALAERAVLPVTFGALDGEASWSRPWLEQMVAWPATLPQILGGADCCPTWPAVYSCVLLRMRSGDDSVADCLLPDATVEAGAAAVAGISSSDSQRTAPERICGMRARKSSRRASLPRPSAAGTLVEEL